MTGWQVLAVLGGILLVLFIGFSPIIAEVLGCNDEWRSEREKHSENQAVERFRKSFEGPIQKWHETRDDKDLALIQETFDSLMIDESKKLCRAKEKTYIAALLKLVKELMTIYGFRLDWQ